MFTGIVEEIGTVKTMRAGGSSALLEIRAEKVLEGTTLGDSIAVNGVCQTVTAIGRDFFGVDVLAETLRKTTLGSLRSGEAVNLERALRSDSRLGGHIVQGHVNTAVHIVRIRHEGKNRYLCLELPPSIAPWCVREGSIAVDGVSLTISSLGKDWLEVDLIPRTLGETTLSRRRCGERVNIETDILGRYAVRPEPEKAETQRTRDARLSELLGRYF